MPPSAHGSSSTRRAARSSCASAPPSSPPRRGGVPRRDAHHEVGGVGQQRCCVRRGLVGLHDHQRARADVVRRVGLGDGAEVGELHLGAGAEGQRPDDERHVEAQRAQRLQALPAAVAEDHGGLLAHEVPGGAELLAQTVVGGVRDGGVTEVAAPVAVVPGRADGERLAAKALLEQLVDVEGRELQLGDGARLTGEGAQKELAAARPLEAPELRLVEGGAAEQVREQRGGTLALAHQRRGRVDDVGEQVLPLREAAVAGGTRPAPCPGRCRRPPRRARC